MLWGAAVFEDAIQGPQNYRREQAGREELMGVGCSRRRLWGGRDALGSCLWGDLLCLCVCSLLVQRSVESTLCMGDRGRFGFISVCLLVPVSGRKMI